eukprot:COSAG02_NODE_59430_length_274_cov_0.800000_1_plen_24_part_01
MVLVSWSTQFARGRVRMGAHPEAC